MTTELSVLQAVRLKGRIVRADLAKALDEDSADIDSTVAGLVEGRLLVDGNVLKLSRQGRDRLAELLDEERRRIDDSALASAYADFRSVNVDLKATVTDWQLRDGQPNTHDDAQYDAAILGRLDDVHRRVVPIVAAAAKQLPRLSSYLGKLQRALDKVKAGDIAWLSRPTIDSYHTVWFELHEELIGAAGLTREAEARSGHAQ